MSERKIIQYELIMFDQRQTPHTVQSAINDGMECYGFPMGDNEGNIFQVMVRYEEPTEQKEEG